MSTPFYDLASLVVVPSGYKTSKVYAQKPLTTDGQLAFTRSTTATRVGPDGLIEKVRTNLALRSQEFETPTWSKGDLTVSANTTATLDPLGLYGADKLILNAISGPIRIWQTQNTSAAEYSFSIYVKYDNRQYVQLLFGGGLDPITYSNFDLINGTITQGTGGKIQSLANGWYRISLTSTLLASTDQLYVWSIDSGTAARGSASTGNGVDGYYVFGAQFETGDIATDYIATTSAAVSVGPVANVPRLDYLGSTCPKLQLEPQRSNLALHSSAFENAVWTKSNVTITANAIAAPDGSTSADLFTTNDDTQTVFRAYETSSAAGQSTGAVSVFMKYGNHQYAFITQDDYSGNTKFAVFDLINGTNTFVSSGYSATITPYANGWYRVTLTGQQNTIAYLQFGLAPNSTNYAGSSIPNGKTAYFWGAQREYSAAYATSYIPTLGAAVTRGEDNTLTASLSGVLPQTAGTLFWDIEYTFLASSTMLMHNTGVSDYCFLQVSGGGLVEGGIYESGVVVDRLAKVGAIATGRHKMAFAYSTNSFALYVDGVLADSGSSGSTANISMNTISLDWNATDFTRINQVLLFPTRLTNAQLAELTTI
jgi:hypothetical protein